MTRVTGYIQRGELSGSIHPLCFLTMDTKQPAASSSCGHVFPTLMGCTLKL